jgi:beta-lactam-binding protein with PASTA domain
MTRGISRALVLLLLLAAGCGGKEPATSGKVLVPDVIGQPRSRATCVLADAGLRWRISPDRKVLTRPPAGCDDASAAGQPDPAIVRQRPAAGARVDRGAVVVLHDQCERRSCA